MILYDFHCATCGHEFEALVRAGEDTAECPECGANADRQMSAPRVGLYNDPNVRAAALRKRSEEHSLREAKKNVEEHAAKMGAKPAAQAKWNIRSQKNKTK